MSGEHTEESQAEVARRSIALLTAVSEEYGDLLDDDEWVWDLLGETREQKISTVLALAGFAVGMASVIGDPREVLRHYASQVDQLDMED